MSGTKGTRCFVDSNVWLYALIVAQNPAKTATAHALLSINTPVVSTQVINEVCRNLIRKARFSNDKIEQVINSFYDNYHVVQVSRNILLTATQLRKKYSVSFWDSLLVSAVLESGVSILYSEDMHHGLVVKGRLRIVNPFAPEVLRLVINVRVRDAFSGWQTFMVCHSFFFMIVLPTSM